MGSNIILVLNSALLGILTTLFFYIYRKMIDSIILQKGMQIKLDMVMQNFESSRIEIQSNIKDIKCNINKLEKKVNILEKDLIYYKEIKRRKKV